MTWQSFAQWQARHSPEYVTAVKKLEMQRQIAHEVEDRRYNQQVDMLRYQAELQERNSALQEQRGLSIERERGKNRLAEIELELDAKIRLMGTETQVDAYRRILDELGKNKDLFRDWMKSRTEFRSQAQMAIINALIAKKMGAESHAQTMERQRLDAELHERKAAIDDVTRKAIAFAEVEAQVKGEAAATTAINELLKKWEE
jgi:hypothetical protein